MDEDAGDDKKLRRGAASQGFLYFCPKLILCSKLSPELLECADSLASQGFLHERKFGANSQEASLDPAAALSL